MCRKFSGAVYDASQLSRLCSLAHCFRKQVVLERHKRSMRVPKNQGVESLRWGMFLEGVNEAEESEQTALHSNALRTKNPLTVLPPLSLKKVALRAQGEPFPIGYEVTTVH